jgi:hypothetical protein
LEGIIHKECEREGKSLKAGNYNTGLNERRELLREKDHSESHAEMKEDESFLDNVMQETCCLW